MQRSSRFSVLPPRELERRSLVDLVHPDDRRSCAEHLAHLKSAPTTLSFENRLKAKDGSSRRLLWRVSSNGGEAPFYAAAHEIPEPDLESIGLLAGGVAHQFNNLLTGILGNASLALEDLPSGSPVRPLLREVVTASNRAAELTRQLLAYSGQGAFQVKRLALWEVVNEMEDLLRASVPRSIDLRLELQADRAIINADPAQIHQMILNLVVNAGEAMEGNEGVITVRTGMRKLTDCDFAAEALHDLLPGDFAVIEVADTGKGMDAQTQCRIFDPFFSTKFVGRG